MIWHTIEDMSLYATDSRMPAEVSAVSPLYQLSVVNQWVEPTQLVIIICLWSEGRMASTLHRTPLLRNN